MAPHKLPDWDNLRVFAALRRRLSFSAAARELGVNATTTSRRLAQLEDQLGTLLFQRTADGLVPTEAAEGVMESVVQMERQVELLAAHASGRDAVPEGPVRLAVTEDFAEAFLIPRLAALRVRYPGIELELVIGDRYVDLTRGEADLAVRFQQPGGGAPSDPRSSLEVRARRLGTIAFAVYASRAYVARAGLPADAFSMKGHDVILSRAASAYLPGSPWFARVHGQGRAVLRVDGVGSMAAAIDAGLGVGVMATFLAADRDGLVQIGPPATIDERELWLLAPGDLARVARVRIVWEYLGEIAPAAAARSPADPPTASARRRKRS
jgi:DNA-binding transcriptional LysR family regulator